MCNKTNVEGKEKEVVEGVNMAKENIAIESTTKKKKKRKKRTWKYFLVKLTAKIVTTIIGVWLLLTYVCGVYVNHNNSSYPMVKDGDLCITYKQSEVIKGDVVAYKKGDKVCFGRIIAKEGEEVDIRDGVVLVDGYNVVEDTVYETSAEESKIKYPYIVPQGKVFILNDFRKEVTDSRVLGGIDESDLKGKLIFLIRRRGF
jgi:signal peptidase I